MHAGLYTSCMKNTVVQIREVPEPVVAVLRERAARLGISFSAYLRELLAHDAAQPTMEEVVQRVAGRSPIDVADEQVLDAIHEGRR